MCEKSKHIHLYRQRKIVSKVRDSSVILIMGFEQACSMLCSQPFIESGLNRGGIAGYSIAIGAQLSLEIDYIGIVGKWDVDFTRLRSRAAAKQSRRIRR